MEFIQEHLWSIIATVATAVFGYLSIKYNVQYLAVKDFLEFLLAGLEDGELTQDEIQGLVERGKKIIGKTSDV